MKMKEEKNCEYCNLEANQFVSIASKGVDRDCAEVGIETDNNGYFNIYGAGGDEYSGSEVSCRIKYCPMCGRKLSND